MGSDTPPLASFGDLLRRHRLAAGLTQEELAERAKVSPRAISDLERGIRKRPWRDTAERLAEALGLEAAERARLKAATRPTLPFSPLAPGVAALPGAGTPRHNLPAPLTSLLGRERERAEVSRLLAASRLVTLTGAGGTGKTRLALKVASDRLGAYAAGVALVDLAVLSDPALVPQTVALALGRREKPDEPILTTLTSHLQSLQLLLLLDNCEHLLHVCAGLAETLLRGCPRLAILATSREPLGLAEETVFRVPPLDVPPPDPSLTPDELTRFTAARLFRDRALAVRGDFVVTPANAPAVAAICRHLDGLPLALELAAARVRVLTVEQIARRLDDRFTLLARGGRSALPRHATLRATLDWSHDLLDEGEQALFRRLAVFAGGWGLEAAEAVGEGVGCWVLGPEPDTQHPTPNTSLVLDRLTRLIDQSLVVVEEVAGEARYRYLETIQQYARERLDQAGETAEARRAHRRFYLALAEQAEFEVFREAHLGWLDRLEREHDNLRAALRECQETDPEAGLRLAGSLWRFWCDRGYPGEARAWLESLLAQAPADAPSQGRALNALGMVAFIEDDFPSAQFALERCLPLLRAAGGQARLALALVATGETARQLREYPRARAVLEEGLAIARTARPDLATAIGLCYLGEIELAEGNVDRAEYLWLESLARSREVRELRCWDYALQRLGFLARTRDDLPRAKDLLDESLELAWRIGHGPGISGTLWQQAELAISVGNYRPGVRLLAASQQVLSRTPLASVTSPDIRAALLQAREQLGADAVERAWTEGETMPLEQAVALALRRSAS